MTFNSTTDKLGLYLHWPYCERICPYCDFNVTRARSIDLDLWEQVLIEDLTYWAQQRPGRLSSVYFGGGTPSLMPAPLVGKILELCGTLWGFDGSPEITLEANPTNAEQDRFLDFRAAGINRLSLGIQSFDDTALSFLGRNHKAIEAQRAIATAQTVFERVTFDLIYGRPGQSLEHWREELAQGVATGTSHLSLYQLTIEPGTAFAKAVTRQDWTPVSDDLQADFYDIAQEMCIAAGLPAYEVSNHARSGHESKHNMIYWQYQDYIGIGPGAHGRLTQQTTKLATEGVKNPAAYLNTKTAARRYDASPLEKCDQATEYLTMGLRIEAGISIPRYETLAGHALDDTILKDLQQDGFVTYDAHHLQLTPKGRTVLNNIVLQLLQ